MIDVGRLITDYIDVTYPDLRNDKGSEIYNDALKSIHFLASRDWSVYKVGEIEE